MSSAVPKVFAEPGARWVARIRRQLAAQKAGEAEPELSEGELEMEAEPDRERLPYRDV